MGLSGGGSLAQLETSSTGLNFRSDKGRCKLIIDLEGSVLDARLFHPAQEVVKGLHMNNHVCLEHEFIDFSIFGQDLLAAFRE